MQRFSTSFPLLVGEFLSIPRIKMNSKPKSIQFFVPSVTYSKLLNFARHIDCVSETEHPKAASAVKLILRAVLDLYSNEDFIEKVEEEGGDTLSYIKRCVRKELQEKT